MVNIEDKSIEPQKWVASVDELILVEKSAIEQLEKELEYWKLLKRRKELANEINILRYWSVQF